MKRLFALFLALVLLLGAAPMPTLAAEAGGDSQNPESPHTHSFHEESRVSPTCTQDGYILMVCSCGATRKDPITALGHSFGLWEVVRQATATSDGLRRRYCSRCTATEDDIIPKKEHTHVYEEIVRVHNSCLTEGYVILHCSCGAEKKEILPALGHDYGPWEMIDGMKVRSCTRCGHKETQNISHTHKYQETSRKEPTCTKNGYIERVCTSCGETLKEVIWALGHDYGAWKTVRPATGQKEGLEERICSRCGDRETRTIPKTDHTHSFRVTSRKEPTCTQPGYIEKTCSCGETQRETLNALGHSYGAWKTTRPATESREGLEERTCSRCGDRETRTIPRLAHTHNYRETSRKEPTCTQDGYILKTCSCGKTQKTVLRATGHKYRTKTVEPTCTERGYTLHTCSVCGSEYKDSYRNALGHSYGAWKTTRPATESREGQEERTCSRCGEKETRTIPRLAHTHSYKETSRKEPTCTQDGYILKTCSCGKTQKTVLRATGHKYRTKTVEPTCTERGYTLHTCSVCGSEYKDSYRNALGHSYGAWKITRPATESREGQEERTCSRCGEKETRTIPRLAHTHSYKETSRKEPTCTQDGYILKTCSCGKTQKTVLQATGHKYETKIIKPTCTEKGYTLHTCSVCGDTYESDPVPMLEHQWGQWQVTRKPTETEEGLEERVCSLCGRKEERSVPLSDHVHHYTKRVVKPTCTEEGYTLYECVCGDSYREDVVPALGHDYEVTVKPATCKQEGYTMHECRICFDYYKDNITPRLKEHPWGDWVVVVEPTWDDIGQAIRKCTVCGTSQHKWIRKPIAEHPDAQTFETCTTPVTGVSRDQDAKAVLEMMNKLREENGLAPLEWDVSMETAAKVRAAECDLKWSHTRPDGSAWHTVSDLVRGENLAKGYFTPESAFSGWEHSSGHRANMLRPNYTKVYIACVVTDNGWYWCQEFR